MYAAVPFYQKTKAAGMKPIVGVALDVSLAAENPIQNVTVPLVLLATDSSGYSNLCQLTTLRHLGALRPTQETFAEQAGSPATIHGLAAHSDGVIALYPSASRFRAESAKRNFHISARLKDIFSDRLYLEVQHLSSGDGRTVREAERLGRDLGIPRVATNNVHFLKPEEHLHHRAVNAIRTNSLLTTVVSPEITSAEAWFKPVAAMQKLFPDHPELLHNSLEIADHCNLQLQLGKLIFPQFPVPQGDSPFSYLWKLSFAGAQNATARCAPMCSPG